VASSGKLHKGLITLGVKSAVGLYADDTTGFVHDRGDYLLFRLEVDLYSMASGMLVNLEKSSIIFLGTEFECTPLQVISRNSTDRLLGFMLGVNAPEKKVYKGTVKKFANRCAVWQSSSLSIVGKATMIQTFAESTLEFTAPFHLYTPAAVKLIKDTYWKAIYNNETVTRLGYSKAVAHSAKGGLGAMNLELRLTAHLALWVPLAEEQKESNWAKLFSRGAEV
jgi:hypothetical protein